MILHQIQFSLNIPKLDESCLKIPRVKHFLRTDMNLSERRGPITTLELSSEYNIQRFLPYAQLCKRSEPADSVLFFVFNLHILNVDLQV